MHRTFRSNRHDGSNSARANQTAGVHVSTLRTGGREVLLLAAAALLTAAGGTAAPSPDAAPATDSTIVVTAPPDVPVVPPAALGTNGDVDQAAVGIAGWAFADPGRTSGRPVVAARAVISLEYIASALSNNPRYIGTSPLVQQQLLAARQEVRDVLGVARGAPSQAVVDALIGVVNAVTAGDVAAQEAALSGPLFTLGPKATFQRLAYLPPLPVANVATQRAQFDVNQPGPR
jgi:hypothetical protein